MKINIKNIFSGKNIPLTILMIIATSTLLDQDSTLILPLLLFVGIVCGIIKHDSMTYTLITAFVAFMLGFILSFIISLISVYYIEGGLYAIALIQSSLVYLILYIFVGCLGSSLGFHIINELCELKQ